MPPERPPVVANLAVQRVGGDPDLDLDPLLPRAGMAVGVGHELREDQLDLGGSLVAKSRAQGLDRGSCFSSDAWSAFDREGRPRLSRPLALKDSIGHV